VRATLGVPREHDDAQVEAWMERRDPSAPLGAGSRICEGTASIGEPREPSALHAKQIDKNLPGELRILADARTGDEFPIVDTAVDDQTLDKRLDGITEPMVWYTDPARWGGRVPTTVNQVNALIEPAYAYLNPRQAPAIGLYGAIELRNVNGPMLAGTTYRAGGRIALRRRLAEDGVRLVRHVGGRPIDQPARRRDADDASFHEGVFSGA
jgi:hypothetical protein